MKSTKWLVVAPLLFTSFPILAQQVDATAQQGATATAAGSSVNQSADVNASAHRDKRDGAQAQGAASGSAHAQGAPGSADASANGATAGSVEMRPVNGELVGNLDSKSAKVGDAVVVKTTQTARTSGGAVIPKGSRLVGHVTDVRAHSKASQESVLAVQFDQAELKGGQTMAIHSVIESISPSASATAMAASSMDSEDSLVGGGMRSSGGGRASGGLAGAALSPGGGTPPPPATIPGR